MVVCFDEATKQDVDIPIHHVHAENVSTFDVQGKYVVFADVPADEQLLKQLLENQKPARIYTVFKEKKIILCPLSQAVTNSNGFMGSCLNGEVFLSKNKEWTLPNIEAGQKIQSFYDKGVFELGFVKIENGVLSIVLDAPKKI